MPNGCFYKKNMATFTYLHADGMGVGSTAFHIKNNDLDIYIEAFPASGMNLDPASIIDAEIIICSNHGHRTHYHAQTVAMVQKQTGAYVVGNQRVERDMLNLGVPKKKIVVLDTKNPGDLVTQTVLGVKITAIMLTHSYVESIRINAFLVKLPGGIKFFHGTCASAASIKKYLTNNSEFYYLDVMMLDYEHDFVAIYKEFHPKHLIKHHEKSGATWWTGYPDKPKILKHGESFTCI
jgi:L-ascorbate metabolism protein UlaG (beta-lactamase superfamily)